MNKEIKLINEKELLDIIFSEESKPSTRWWQMHKHLFPKKKIGRLIFYSLAEVMERLKDFEYEELGEVFNAIETN